MEYELWRYRTPSELYHHGVKGQRWGVRRYQNKDGSLTPSGKKRYKQSYSDEAKSLSDDELRSRVNRMSLEKRYMDANSGGKSSTSKTVKNISSAGSNAGKVAKNISEMNGTKKPELDIASQSLNAASKAVDTGVKINTLRRDAKTAKNTRKTLEKMSDSELKATVERLELERSYSNLKQETVSRGKVRAEDIISIAGSVLAVGASATAIALNISKMKKG